MRGATASRTRCDGWGRSCARTGGERGPHVADAAWVDEPFDDWLAMLHEGKPLARTSMLALAVGMDQTLAVRDALIVSIVGGADGARKAVLMDFASRPACAGGLRAHGAAADRRVHGRAWGIG